MCLESKKALLSGSEGARPGATAGLKAVGGKGIGETPVLI